MGKFRAITLLNGAAKVSDKMTIIYNPYIEIRMLKERIDHQMRNISAIHGRILFNGPDVHVLSGSIHVSMQIGDD